MKQLTIEASTKNLDTVLSFVNAELEALSCAQRIQVQLDIAVEEIFVNIAHYAYRDGTGEATVRMEVRQEPTAVTITFIDSGTPYDPLSHEDPDITLSAEDRKIGGLGIYMVKKYMDHVSYQYQNGQNILTIQKTLN